MPQLFLIQKTSQVSYFRTLVDFSFSERGGMVVWGREELGEGGKKGERKEERETILT